jgi:tRNA nucleotidyltransferase (CCA-adding enzyme)
MSHQEQASVPTTVILPDQAELISPSPDAGTIRIRLDATEVRIFDTMLAAADAFSSGSMQLPLPLLSTKPPQTVEIRVAGGWVRDKVLGINGYDIDIAIDCLTGLEFATLVQEYLQKCDPTEKTKKIGVIAANPSQSKHLETATMKVHGIEVDFCNLRAHELYESDSRIPTTSFGTPKEDAERRDFTINSLFFNIRTKQVEDWTQRGLQDLNQGILVTPLDPVTTFQDDPLRVLRGIRFAIRFDFHLHQDLEAACRSPAIHQALKVKVSRERVGKELEGMLSGKGAKPHQALDLIGRLDLAHCLFIIPDLAITGTVLGHPFDEDTHALLKRGWEESRRLLVLLEESVLSSHAETVASSTFAIASSTVDRRLLALAVFLMPFRHLLYMDQKMKQHSVVEFMMRDGIKFKNKDVQDMSTVMDAVDKFSALLQKVHSAAKCAMDAHKPAVCRLEAGLLLRSTKDLWITCLLAATVQHPEYLEVSQRVYSDIVAKDLDGCWKTKPLLDGKAVIQALGLPGGPAVGEYLEVQIRWMLMHPSGTKEECTKHLIEYKEDRESQHKKMKIESSSQ